MEQTSKARICVPICAEDVRDIEPAMIRAAEFGDLIEIRIDCLTPAGFNDIENKTAELCRQKLRPLIFTLRPLDQGGFREVDQATRFGFWFNQCDMMLRDNKNYIDIELDIGEGLAQVEPLFQQSQWDRVICSYHDFAGVPANLEEIYKRMIATKARILKIAVKADSVTDCLPVMRFLDRARGDGREMIAIAMGEAGILTRILGPSRGSFLTYGSLDETNATAPGQISASELRDLYRIHSINEATEIMGLVGGHVKHSISPKIHNEAFAASKRNAVYIPLEVGVLDDFVHRMVHPGTRELSWNLRGLSITAPHKSAIIRHLDWIDPIALEIGAVNTVVITNGGLHGYNTDALASLAPLDGIVESGGARVAVLGAGGAARALLWSLRKAGAHVTVFARDVKRGTETATQFDAEFKTLEGAAFGEFEIVVNTTPLGTRGLSEDATPAIASQLRGVRIAYDLVYNPIETRFMREAHDAGCECIGGIKMLIAQAEEQVKLWTGEDAPGEVMRAAALRALGINEK